MNILFVSGHPAQIHNFKLVKKELESHGHKVFWLATDKDISRYLLEKYNIKYSLLEKPQKSFLSKIRVLFLNTKYSTRFIKSNKIDIVVSRISPYLALASFLLRKPHITLTDTESAGFYDRFFCKFTNALLTSSSFQKTLRSDQIRFNSNIELFYLHPNRFKPLSKEDISRLLGINNEDQYVLMRFVGWDAFHDKGLYGFSEDNKLKAVNEFSKLCKIFISAEKTLPDKLEPYRVKIPVEYMHDVLANAIMFFGESATMATESAVLGTPAVFLNQNWFGSTGEAENYGLLFSYKEKPDDQINAINKGIELLKIPHLKNKMLLNNRKYLKDKIDITAFMVWFIENYPSSYNIMMKNPGYQIRFNKG